jgi:hypothetical protein
MHINVSANGFNRRDKPVEVEIDPDLSIARVFEVDCTGTVTDGDVPFQRDPMGLVFTLTGATPADATRHFRAEFGSDAPTVAPQVTLIDGVEDEGQQSYQVNTPGATWLYHKLGAGFSSLLDPDGLDWLSYRPGGGSAGEYRGIPSGQLDEEAGTCVRSDGTRMLLSERWEGSLPAPEWLYFGAGNVERVLYLVHHEADGEIDSYWPMEHNMTVFGFGRLGLEKFMTRVPARFTVGFAEDGAFERVQSVIDSAFRPLRIDVS